MSGPVIPVSVQDELRRRFALWSLAIFGSLSGSGTVQLVSNVWSADEPPAGSSVDDKATQSPAVELDTALDRDILQRLIDAKKFDEAGERVDAMLAKSPTPDTWYLSYILASNLSRVEPARAEERFVKTTDELADQLAAKPSPRNFSTFIMSTQSLALLLDRQDRTNEALEVLEKALVRVESQPNSYGGGLAASVVSQRARLLIKAGRTEEAQELLAKRVEEAIGEARATPTSISRRALPAIISAYSGLFRDSQATKVERYYGDAEALLNTAVDDSAGVEDYISYQTLQIARATELSDLDAQAALDLLEKLQTRAVELSKRLDEAEQKRLLGAQSTLKAASSRIHAKMLHTSLLGQPAPEFEIGAVVNLPSVTWAELRGKVVLLDFWAIWCGPCIATFPHLQRWHQEYGQRGLVIIGITRQYGYAWDEVAERHVPKSEATLEEEAAMLDQFRKQYKLEHGFVVTPLESEFSRKFGVTGIPQAVLVDQNGNIQLIRVGSGEKNAQDLEAKIKELLGTTAEVKPDKPASAG